MKKSESYEIDLGNAIIRVYVTWEPLSFSTPPNNNFYYIVSVDYNDRVFTGNGKTETEALQNLGAKIKLAKELG